MPNSKEAIKESYAKAINKFSQQKATQQSSCCSSPSSSQSADVSSQSD
jgi:hypothetical protein